MISAVCAGLFMAAVLCRASAITSCPPPRVYVAQKTAMPWRPESWRLFACSTFYRLSIMHSIKAALFQDSLFTLLNTILDVRLE